MAIRTFNSVGGFSVGEIPVTVVSNGTAENASVISINNVDFANIGNTVVVGNTTSNVTITSAGNIVAANLTANSLSNTRVTFAGTGGILQDSANLRFTGGNVLTIIDAANITDGTNYISITGGNGGITTSGNVSFAAGAMTVNTDGDVAVANSFVVGYNATDGDSAFYVDAEGNFSIKIANAAANDGAGGFDTVFSVDAATGDITTAGSVVNPTGGAATIQAPGANTQVLFNDASNVGASTLFTFDKIAQALSVDGNIQLIDTSESGSAGRLVLPNGGYLYEDGQANSAVLHSEGSGFAQLEYIDSNNDSYVWVDADGATMEQGSSSVVVKSIGVNVSVDGSLWNFDNNGNLIAPGGIYANSGEVKASTLKITSTSSLDGKLTVNAASDLLGLVTIGNTDPAGTSANLDVSGNLHVYQDASIDGGLTIGNLHVTNFVTSNLIPSVAYEFDLGSEEYPWRDLWLSGSSIKLGSTTLTSTAGNTFTTANANIFTTLTAGDVITTGFANIGNITNTADLFVSGVTSIGNGTVNATSTTTGALKVNGGVGVTGNIYVGGKANITSNLLVGTDLTTGAASANITGNLNVGNDTTIGGNLVITKNLTVSGTTTYINTTNSSLTDALIDLGGDGEGGDATTGDGKDRGLVLHSFNNGAINQFIGWKAVASEFQMLNSVTEADGVVSGSLANLSIDHLTGIIGTATQDEITDMGGLVNIAVSGNANVTGTANIAIANIAAANITTSLDIGELSFPILDYSTTINSNEIISLATDGEGQLGFEVIHTDRIANATSSVFVNSSDIVATVGSNTFTLTSTGANITGNLEVVGLLSAGSLEVGSLTPESIAIGNTNINASTFETTTATSQVIAELPVVAGQAVEFFVKGKCDLGSGIIRLTVATVTAAYNGDGTNVDYVTYGKLHMPSTGSGAGELSVSYDDEAGNIQLLATPTSSTTTVWTAQIRTI